MGCTGCTFENLTVANMYVHTNDANGLADNASACSSTLCYALFIRGSNITVANNTFHDEGWALREEPNSTDSNIQIYGNTIYNIGHGIELGATASGGSIGPVLIYSNHIYNFANWATTSDTWHDDGIHCFVSGNAGGVPPHYNGLYIYDNLLGPGGQSGTAGFNADLFLEGGSGSGNTPCADSTSPIYVFNNVMSATSDTGCGVDCEYTGNIFNYNNTLIGNDTSGDTCHTFNDGAGYTVPTSMSFENDLTTTCNVEIDAASGSFASGHPNHNVYANGGSNSFVCRAGTTTNFYSVSQFAAWKSCVGGDAISSTASNAMLNSNASPQSGSPAIGAGANLTSLCSGYLVPLCSAINGTPRPTTGAWNAGAY